MNKNKDTNVSGRLWTKIVLYAVCVLFVVFYLLVFWWGKHPNVGIEYKMFYLTNELSDWPGYGNLVYQTGTEEICTGLKDRNGKEVSYQVCRRKGQGWKKEQYEGSVNSGPNSWIYYLMKENEDNAVLALNINGYSGENEVKVYANDELIGSFDREGEFLYHVTKVKKDELLTIKFDAGDATFSLWSIGFK